jgi:hypothetical protein
VPLMLEPGDYVLLTFKAGVVRAKATALTVT